jgi:hypothetical protein
MAHEHGRHRIAAQGMVVMMKTWFTESVIGLDIIESGATAVQVTSSGLFGRETFAVDRIRHRSRGTGETDIDLAAGVLSDFPSGVPVVPVAHPGICDLIPAGQKKTCDLETLRDTLKPLVEHGGTVWLDNDGTVVADTGAVKRIINAVNHLGTVKTTCPGAVSLLQSLSSIQSLSETPHSFVIHANPPGFTLVALTGGTVRYCRTVYCAVHDLPDAVDTGFRTVHKAITGWTPSVITCMGSPADIAAVSSCVTRIPVVEWSPPPSVTISLSDKMKKDPATIAGRDADSGGAFPPGWAAAAGAAIAWMIRGRQSLLTDAVDRTTGGGIPVTRRSVLLLRSACLFLLMGILGWMTVILMFETDMSRLLEASVDRLSAAQTAADLPGVSLLPSSLNGLRNHTYLSFIADKAAHYELELTDVHVTLNRIDIQGFGGDIAGINGFSRELSRHFSGNEAVVLSPVTHRGLSERLVFRQEIVWRDAR